MATSPEPIEIEHRLCTQAPIQHVTRQRLSAGPGESPIRRGDTFLFKLIFRLRHSGTISVAKCNLISGTNGGAIRQVVLSDEGERFGHMGQGDTLL